MVSESLLFSAIVFILLIFTFFGISIKYIEDNRLNFKCKPDVEINRIYIKTLQDRVGETHGRFVLGTGNVQSNSYYYFYALINDSTYRLEKLNINEVSIVETDIEVPYVSKYLKEIDVENMSEKNWILFPNSMSKSYYWKIYVPKNTIVVQYMLDGK